MRIISKKRLQQAKGLFPESASALEGWYRIMNKNDFKDHSDLKSTFGSVDKVDSLYVFNIGGNKIRLISSIHFNRQRLYIRHILSHKDYDKAKWKE